MRKNKVFLILISLLLFLFSNCSYPRLASSSPKSTNVDFSDLEQKYGVNFVFSNVRDTWDLVNYKVLTENEKKTAKVIMTRILEIYPENFLKKINLQNIVLVKELKFLDDFRAAVPDNYMSSIFFSMDSSYTDNYKYHADIHELNHYIEYYLWNDYYYKWPEYDKLYDGTNLGGKTAYDNKKTDYYSYTPDLTGFLNKYSKLAPEEDRSEIIAFYFCPIGNEHNNLISKCKNDKIMKDKTVLMLSLYESLGFKDLLKSFYKELESK